MINNVTKNILRVLCLIPFIILIGLQINKIKDINLKMLFITLTFLLFFALISEGKDTRCLPLFNCPDDFGKQFINNPKKLACTERHRVNWRRALIIAYFILLVINIINYQNYNFIIFLFTFSSIYYYLNFDQYHRYHQACLDFIKSDS